MSQPKAAGERGAIKTFNQKRTSRTSTQSKKKIPKLIEESEQSVEHSKKEYSSDGEEQESLLEESQEEEEEEDFVQETQNSSSGEEDDLKERNSFNEEEEETEEESQDGINSEEEEEDLADEILMLLEKDVLKFAKQAIKKYKSIPVKNCMMELVNQIIGLRQQEEQLSVIQLVQQSVKALLETTESVAKAGLRRKKRLAKKIEQLEELVKKQEKQLAHYHRKGTTRKQKDESPPSPVKQKLPSSALTQISPKKEQLPSTCILTPEQEEVEKLMKRGVDDVLNTQLLDELVEINGTKAGTDSIERRLREVRQIFENDGREECWHSPADSSFAFHRVEKQKCDNKRYDNAHLEPVALAITKCKKFPCSRCWGGHVRGDTYID